MDMKRTVCVALLTWLVVVVASVFVFAAEEEIIPIIDRLPEEILIFGASGGAIVSLLLSILKYFRIVGKDGVVPTQLANFVLPVIVAAVAYVIAGQPVGQAVLTAFAAMVAASGLH